MINCNLCKNLVVDGFACSYSCRALGCGCHNETSNFNVPVGQPIPRKVPDVGESKCPGMIKDGNI